MARVCKLIILSLANSLVMLFFAIKLDMFGVTIRNCDSQQYQQRIISTLNSSPVSQKINQRNDIYSTCSNAATAYGPHQNVISFSFYVDTDFDFLRLVGGLVLNLEHMRALYPGWLVRVYSNVSKNIDQLKSLFDRFPYLYWCDITDIPKMGDMSSMDGRTWRFLPFCDPLVDIFLSRDLDSSISIRERIAVKEWEENSNYSIHVMRDHLYHGVEMLGGTWGSKNYMLRLHCKHILPVLIKESRASHGKGYDQKVLGNVIYSQLADVTMAHDSYTCSYYQNSRPFSTQRGGVRFVGDLDGTVIPIHPCPEECRPSYGKNWTYC